MTTVATSSSRDGESMTALQLPAWILPFTGDEFKAFRRRIDQKIAQHRAKIAAQMTPDTQICKFPLFKGGVCVCTLYPRFMLLHTIFRLRQTYLERILNPKFYPRKQNTALKLVESFPMRTM